jgi:5-methyltetrahydropteroyltriglutamate--homocysteine methyltransferase
MRVDQVGSLCAPLLLRQIFNNYKRGKASEEELGRAKDDAIRDVIHKQEAIGFPVLSDGELRRRNFQESFSESVAGCAVGARRAEFQRAGPGDRDPAPRDGAAAPGA